jgi:nitrogen-specific signal transduction histidine kinase
MVFYLSFSVYYCGLLQVSSGIISITLIVALLARKALSSQNLAVKKWAVCTFYEATQALVMTAAFYLCGTASGIFCLASTTVLALTETSPLYSAAFNICLCVKHVMLWTVILSQTLALNPLPHGLLPGIWGCVHVLLCLSAKKAALQHTCEVVEELKRQEARLDGLLQAVPDGILVLSEYHEVITYNRMFLTQMDLPPSQAVDITLLADLKYAENYTKSSDFTPLEDIMRFKSAPLGSVLQFSPILKADQYFECRGSVVQWDHRKACILTIHDTTHRIRLEMRANSENARKTALLRSVSHELRTPTNAILNLAIDFKHTESLTQAGKRDIELAISATSFLLNLINDLLDFTRIVYESFALVKKEFSLKEVLQECLQLIEPQCRAKQVGLTMRLDPLLPTYICTDPNRLKQVILNLLSNSLK